MNQIFKGLFVNYHNKTGLEEVFKNYFEILSIEFYEEFEELSGSFRKTVVSTPFGI